MEEWTGSDLNCDLTSLQGGGLHVVKDEHVSALSLMVLDPDIVRNAHLPLFPRTNDNTDWNGYFVADAPIV